MNDRILDILRKKYDFEFIDNQVIKDKPQQMTEINKLRFQNITYTAAKSEFEAWRMRFGLKSKIEEKIRSYDEEVSTERREDLAADIAILMSKYKFLKTNERESPEIIERRAIRLNQGMIDNANGRVSVILKELDREAKKEAITRKNAGTISEEEREELEAEIERVKSEQKATKAVEESSEDELVQEEIVNEVPEEEKEKQEIDDPSELDSAVEVDLEVEEAKEKRKPTIVIPVTDINRYYEQNAEKQENNKAKEENKKDKTILRIPMAKVEKYNNKQKEKEDKKEILRIPLKAIKDYNKSKDDKGVIAQGMTDEEIEASKKLLEETAPKTKEKTTTFKAGVPRERNEGETTREYERYLDEFYKNLREDYYRTISGKKEDNEPKEETQEKPKERNYREEINRLKELGEKYREQVKATKEAKRRANESVEEAEREAEEKRKIEKEEIKRAEEEKAKAEELRRKKQEAMDLVIEQFNAYIEGMKKEIEETEEDIKSAKEKEQQIKDASMQETERNNERKAAAYKKRDEANETISSQDEYIKEMLNSMKKEESTESKKSK